MARKPVRGLFITGTDTEIGKTTVAAAVALRLTGAGHHVGVYKPAASGCSAAPDSAGQLISSDALALWEAAGRPGTLAEVCPQVFAAPLAPHLAAKAEGKQLDAELLRRGIRPWLERSDVVLVEGAGGLFSPLGEDEFVADLAYDLGFPLLVVAPNRLGVINHVLQTLIAASTFRDGLQVAGIVLNHCLPAGGDASLDSNAAEIRRHAVPPLLAQLGHNASDLVPELDWFEIAQPASISLAVEDAAS